MKESLVDPEIGHDHTHQIDDKMYAVADKS